MVCEAKRKNGEETTGSFVKREKERFHGFTKNREREVFTYRRDGERHRETISTDLKDNDMSKIS